MVVIQECFGIYTYDWSCFKEDIWQIFVEVKKIKKVKQKKSYRSLSLWKCTM